MTFEQYWAILRKQWKFILICFVVAGIGTYIESKLSKPLYQSTALVQVAISSSNSDINNLLASDQLVQTEAILATSNPVLREVASHYQGVTVDLLTKEVTATARMNTQIFEIDVTDASSTRAAAIANDTAATLIKQQQQIFHQEPSQGEFLIIVQNAVPNLYPTQPNTMLNTAAGLLAGLFLGMLLAVLIEQFDTKVRSVEDLTKLLSWPVLATIGQSKPEEVISSPDRHPNAISYRILRTNIGFSVIDHPLRSLLITSAMPGEGKSIIAANLAIFMASAGKNTLLVDANLHSPTQHTQFGLPPNQAGLTHAIAACNMMTTRDSFSHKQFLSSLSSMRQSNTPFPPTFSLEPFMHSVGIPSLRVMPAGSPQPHASELLASGAMQRLIDSIENCGAEVVIVDAPSLLGLTDASILASMVGATLFVVDITQAHKKNLKLAKALITQTGTRILGCIVNKQRWGGRDTPFTYHYHVKGQSNKMNPGTQNGHITIAPSVPLITMPSYEQKTSPN